MRLSQDIIFYRLAEKIQIRFAKRCESDIKAKRPIFYSKGKDVTGYTVVIDADELMRLENLETCVKGTLLICSGGLPDDIALPSCSLIVCRRHEPLQDIFNILQDIFDLMEQWYESLNNVYYESNSFKELIDCCDLVFYDPMSISDNNFQYVAYSDSSVDRGLVESKDGVDIFAPDHVVREFYSIANIDDIQSRRTAYVYPFSFGCCICKSLFHNGEHIGHIAIPHDVVNNELFGYYAALLEILAAYIEKLYGRFSSFNIKDVLSNNFRNLLEDFVINRSVPAGLWEQALGKVGWREEDCFLLIQFKPNLRYGKAFFAKHVITDIERIWKGCICFECHDELLLLVDLDQFSSGADITFYQSLAYFLRDNLLTAGLSRVFTDINDLPLLHEQTRIALEIGAQNTPTLWYHKFDDHALAYMQYNCAGSFSSNPVLICSDKLIKLKKVDEEKHTDYYQTLKTYIMCKQNATEAARQLFIHRSSFLKRMDRIQELVNIDFDCTDEILYLTLSFKLLEQS